MRSKSVLSIFLTLLLATGLYGQAADSVGQFAGRYGANLAQQARNPTAALTMMQIIVSHNPNFHNLEGDQTSIVVMPIIPFKTGKLQHIARIILPYVAAGPDSGELSRSLFARA